MSFLKKFWSIVLLCQSCLVWCQSYPEVDVSQIPLEDQTYTFDADSRCRLYAHSSIELHNDDHHILVIDGGFGLFCVLLNGDIVQVPDLNPLTVAYDLSKDFSTSELDVLWSYRKAHDSSMKRTIVNFGGLWSSEGGNTILLQGGHFYHSRKYLNSSYFIPKSEIPEWELWEMRLSDGGYKLGWTNITTNISGYEVANRSFAGTVSSPAGSTKKFSIGGQFDSTTSPTTPNDTIQSTNQMLIFDETEKSITRQKIYSSESTEGYWQGELTHLPIGGANRSGYLISLMSLSHPVASPWPDLDGESGTFEEGTNVALDSIPMYDIDKGEWFEQKTTWYKGELPASRTRFCAALFHDKKDGTWDLWVHGGNQVGDNQNQGIEEIYVLSMPSFIWSKVETTLPQTNLIRSHTCHAIGGQLLIIGGWPTGVNSTNATCDPEYIKILDIGEETPVWSGQYKKNSVYHTPNSIKKIVAGRTSPQEEFANSQLEKDFASTSSSKNVGLIVGPLIGGLVVLSVMAFFLWRKWRPDHQPGPNVDSQSYGQPDVIESTQQSTRWDNFTGIWSARTGSIVSTTRPASRYTNMDGPTSQYNLETRTPQRLDRPW